MSEGRIYQFKRFEICNDLRHSITRRNKHIQSTNLWKSQSLDICSIGRGNIGSSNPLNGCIKIFKAIFNNTSTEEITIYDS